MGLGEKIWGNSIGANVVYGKDGTTLVPLKVNADGELVVNLEAATVNIGDVDIQSLPSGNLGQQHKAASLSIAPADDIADGTYLGDIKFGEAIPDTAASDLAHIHAGIDAVKTAVEGATPAGTAFVGRTGMTGFKILQSFTRPADTTAYVQWDAMTNNTSAPAIMSQDLANFGATVGRFLVITNARVISSVKGSGLSCNIVIFPATFAATNDNAELSVDDTTAALGGLVIPCNNNYTLAVNARAVSDPGWWEMQLGAASTTLYFCLQAAAGYTPASAEVFTVVMEGFML